jgi:hypothetical protein
MAAKAHSDSTRHHMVGPFREIGRTLLEGMAGTMGLEPAASAVTESLAHVTYWNLTVLTARS